MSPATPSSCSGTRSSPERRSPPCGRRRLGRWVTGQGLGRRPEIQRGHGLAPLRRVHDRRVEHHVVVEQAVQPAREIAPQVAVPLVDDVLDHWAPPFRHGDAAASGRTYRNAPPAVPRRRVATRVRCLPSPLRWRHTARRAEEGRWRSRSRWSTTWCSATTRTWWPTSAPHAAPGSSTGATPAPRAVRTEFTPVDMATDGRGPGVHHRGVRRPRHPVPFVAAMVDCGGTSVRANLINVPPDPEHVTLGMKVRLATEVIGTDDERHRGHRVRLRALRRLTGWHLTTCGSSGIHMTKFGKHPDMDLVDLASEAVLGALADGGVTMKDMGVIGGRQPDGGQRRHRPAAAEAARPDRHPGVQRGQCLRHRRHRPAGRHAWPSRPARPTWAWPSAWRSSPGAGLLGRAAAAADDADVFDAVGPLRGRGPGRRTHRHRDHARASSPRSAWSTATATAAPASSCSPGSARRTTPTRPSTPWPPTEEDDPRGDHGRPHDRLPEHPAHVLGQLRRRRRRRGGQRRQARRRSPSSSSGGRSRSRPRC